MPSSAIGIGNIAKLRNVCEQMLKLLTVPGFEDGGMSVELDEEQVIMWRESFRDALSEPPRVCDKYENHLEEDGLLAAFKKHCDECDCPMGCIHRRLPTRGDSRDLPILGCFARFALSKVSKEGGVS